MLNKALVVIDIQNDITKNYKEIIDNINQAIDWAVGNGVHMTYICHEHLSAGTRTFKTGTGGAELVPDSGYYAEINLTLSGFNLASKDHFKKVS